MMGAITSIQDDEPFIRVVSAGLVEDRYDYKGDFENSIDYDYDKL